MLNGGICYKCWWKMCVMNGLMANGLHIHTLGALENHTAVFDMQRQMIQAEFTSKTHNLKWYGSLSSVQIDNVSVNGSRVYQRIGRLDNGWSCPSLLLEDGKAVVLMLRQY